MRLPLCIIALALSAWAAEVDTPGPNDAPDQSQAPAPQTPAPADAAKPADATPPAPPAKLDGFVISGLADGYITMNFNHPSQKDANGNDTHPNQLQNFNLGWGQPLVSLVKVTIDKSDKMVGFHLDTGFGQSMRLIHAGDVAAQEHQALRYFEQMYAIAKPNHLHGTEIDFGQFVTSAGAEVIEASTNWNYTRSLLFAWAIPYYHFGLRTNTPITKTFSAGVQVVNAWNTVWGNNNFRNVGITTALTMPKYAWTVNYYVGPNHLGASEGKRNLIDSTLTLTPGGKVSFYINGDYGRDNRIGGGYDSWYGLAGAAHIQLTKKISFSPRGEFFNDHTGFSTGRKQILKEGTLTGEYKYNDHLLARVEYRHDASDQPFFDRGAQQAVSKNMNTVTFALMGILGPMK
jgi:hypothetical protein